jgi:hypothetical protein
MKRTLKVKLIKFGNKAKEESTVGEKKFGTRSVQFLLLISLQCFNGF